MNVIKVDIQFKFKYFSETGTVCISIAYIKYLKLKLLHSIITNKIKLVVCYKQITQKSTLLLCISEHNVH